MALADACFLPAGPDDTAARPAANELRRLHALMARHLCAAHTCDKRRKRAHLQAVAQAHHRRSGGGDAVVAASIGASLAAFWLLLALAASGDGRGGRPLRRLGSVRAPLAAAAEACLPTKVHGD